MSIIGQVLDVHASGLYVYLEVKKKEEYPGWRAALFPQYSTVQAIGVADSVHLPRSLPALCLGVRKRADHVFKSSKIQVFNVERPDWSE
jgi:hypothetical protein